MNETILIFDFGSQYTQLIARRLRELNVYCEIYPFNKFSEQLINSLNTKGVILSGSPFSVRTENAPDIDLSCVRGKLPVLGICYGAQLIAFKSGGEVMPSEIREYGRANLNFISDKSKLVANMSMGSQVWMSHGDTISGLPDDFSVIASTADVKVAGYKIDNEDTYGIQFHPEVFHTTEGAVLLKNFVTDICGCTCDWTPASFIETTVNSLREKIKDDKVILGLSGGVDSSVAAMLLHKAIGNNLTCIFVDNGLLRKDEFCEVLASYQNMGLNVIGVDAKQRFYDALKGITDPETKRKAIGRTFVEVFDS